MRDKDLYAQILGIKSPWRVTDVELEVSQSTVTVHVGRDEKIAMCCPLVCKAIAGLRFTQASLASPGHVSIQDDCGGGRAASDVRRARGHHEFSAVGGTGQWFHGVV